MNPRETSLFSEQAANMVENLACRIAERHGGRLMGNHLVPYLPMSLGLIESCLENMVDGSSVFSEKKDNLIEYEFAAYKDAPIEPGMLRVSSCLSCDADLSAGDKKEFCSSCSEVLQSELNRLAETTGWPAQAVYEHEILRVASNHKGAVHAEDLAGHSRYTLRNVRQKLDRMSLDGYLRQELDQDAGMMVYHFPEISYPKEHYRANMTMIRAYPASVMEEVQIRVVRILFALGLLFLALLVMAFLHVPFPLLILLFLVAAPLVSFLIWRHRSRPEDE
jgi:hypothetical protein